MAPDDVGMGRWRKGEVSLLHLLLLLLLLEMLHTGDGLEVMRRQVVLLLLMLYWHWYTLHTHRCAQVCCILHANHNYFRINSYNI